MNTFAPLQYKSAQTTPSARQQTSVVRSLRTADSSHGTQETIPDRQQGMDFSLARILIDSPYQASNDASGERRKNTTSLPDKLKTGIEKLSGLSLDDVKVHYNSSKPAGVEALAYTQGTDIHVGAGQEEHLAHEAWHVVQQRQGRVRSTLQLHGVGINDDQRLEREADMMGAKASSAPTSSDLAPISSAPASTFHANNPGIVQRTTWKHDGTQWVVESRSNTDTDGFPHPNTQHPNASLGDTYDQNTGAYTSPLRNNLAAVGNSSGSIGFYDRRARTGFSYASGKNRQGPHTLAHITKRVAMGAGVATGRDPLKLVGSPALPRPRRMNKMLRDRLKNRGPNWKKETRKLRTQYLKLYLRNYKVAKGSSKQKQALDALRKGMELNPATVYNIGSGKASAAQMAGKGERRDVAATDLTTLLNQPNVPASSLGLTTMDTSGASALEANEADRSTRAMAQWLRNDEASSDSGESESDSDMDLDE